MLRRFIVAGGFAVLSTAVTAESSLLTVAVDEYAEFTSSTAPGTTVDVLGTLRVLAGAEFTPDNLNVGLVTANNGDGNEDPDALPGDLNGDVYFDGGAISSSVITTGDKTRVFVNTFSSAASVTSEGEFFINAAFGVSGAYQTSNRTTIASGATLTAATFSFSEAGSPNAVLDGTGTLSAGIVDFAFGDVSPGGPTEIGTLTIESAAVSFADALISVDLANPAPSWDQIIVNGNITAGGIVLPMGFEQFTAAELEALGTITFITADSIAGEFMVLDPEFQNIYDDNAELVATMEIHTTSQSVYFQYTPVPEPTVLGVAGLAISALVRRRRA